MPEWKSPYNTPIDGAELWEAFLDGAEILRAKFSAAQNKFIPDKWGLTWDGAVQKATKNGIIDYDKIIKGASTPLGNKQQLGLALYNELGSGVLPTLNKYRMTELIPK